jgi:proline racemase
MRSSLALAAVDSHTEGMPTRVITGGVGVLPGASMAERRERFLAERDGLRRFLVQEPRGHSAMSGAILQPPTEPGADYGVLFVEVSGCLPMCGHGTIGVATVLVETGMVEVTDPETVIRLEVPAGIVEARVRVSGGAARSVTLRNVPSFCLELDATVDVPAIGPITYDMAYGGNFYAIVQAADLGVEFRRSNAPQLIDAGLKVMEAINAHRPVVHPERGDIAGCHHVYVAAPGSDARHSRHAMVIHPGWIDRSPCGTGTSARMAALHARGELPLGTEFTNESLIGSSFQGRLVGTADVGGLTAVVPEVTGRAWITGTATYLLDPEDPFPEGFSLTED